MTGINEYEKEQMLDSEEYKMLCDLLFHMQKQCSRYPKLKAFLWTLESRGFKGRYYGIAREEDMQEQVKLVNSFLSLNYWGN